MAIQLLMKNKDGTSRTFDVHKDTTTIGRRRSCDLHVAIPAVAPVHCQLTLRDGSVSIVNCDPDSETLHNGSVVSSANLIHEDRVQVGPVEFTIVMSDDETVIRRH